MSKRLTIKRLHAISSALESALAGEIGEGDFQGMEREPFESAAQWACEEIARRTWTLVDAQVNL